MDSHDLVMAPHLHMSIQRALRELSPTETLLATAIIGRNENYLVIQTLNEYGTIGCEQLAYDHFGERFEVVVYA